MGFLVHCELLLDKLDLTTQPDDVRQTLAELLEIRDDATPIIGIAQGITDGPEAVKSFEDKMVELGFPDEATHQNPPD